MNTDHLESMAATWHRRLADGHMVAAWFNFKRAETLVDFDVAFHLFVAFMDYRAARKHERRSRHAASE